MSDLPSASFQQSLNSDNLNSTVMGIFLYGIYTTIFFGTLYTYLSRRASQRRTIVATITVLYLLTSIQIGIQWWTLQRDFIDYGDTRLDSYMAFYSTPTLPRFLIVFTTVEVLVIADGLLVWRCYHVWQGSRSVLALPMLLWVGEFALSIASIIFTTWFSATQKAQDLVNDLQAALYFVSSGQSIAITLLIAYRIHSLSSWNASSTKRFKAVLDIIIQSSALYSLGVLSTGIYSTIPISHDVLNPTTLGWASYTAALSLLISGMAPTIMVVRVALLAPDTTFPSGSAIPQLSVLQFRGTSTVPDQDRHELENSARMDQQKSDPLQVENRIA